MSMYATPMSTITSKRESHERDQRTRIARACDSCYKRKIKCDADIPQCNWCKHHNLSCTFTRLVGRSRKKKPDPSQQLRAFQLSERIEKIEKLLTGKVYSKDSGIIESNSTFGTTPDLAPVTQSFCPSTGTLHFAGFRLGEICSYTGIPLFSLDGQQWIQSRTGQTVTFEKLCAFGPPWQNLRRLDRNSLSRNSQTLQGAAKLPKRDIVEKCTLTYSSSTLRFLFPLIDTMLFDETIKLAYQPDNNNDTGVASAEACIYSFLAFASVFNLHGGTSPAVDSEACALKAEYLLPRVLHETTIDSLQTAVMLLVFQLFSGNLQSAALMTSVAARILFNFGAHVQSYPDNADQTLLSTGIGPRTEHHLRNLFWVCYTFDKDLCLRTGQPPAINDEHCNLTLPPKYVEELYTDLLPQLSSAGFVRGPLFPFDLRLAMIKSRAYTALYSARALQKSDAELLKDIRELDDELEKWRTSLPQKFRPTISFSHDTPTDNEMNMQSVTLRLVYHHCVAAIHQAGSRCKAWVGGQSRSMEGVSSSQALSVEASRSSLFYLLTARYVLSEESFWVLVFYPITAVLTIFCNILLNPLDPRADEDLDLLNKVPDLIKRIPSRELSLNKVMHIKLTEDFLTELSRLGKCAIIKASKENSGCL
ncbi:hypothetical protein V1525DRAFT_415432 [Lipomyces kononenkoae]|uniref:Uncharacterized protein n=1 Tax=Lipomyces kononenkoae TaxID=34357 RepID=A0ACC3SQ39_LIPKO